MTRLIFFILKLSFFIVLNACEASDVDSLKTKKSLTWLENYYKKYPIGGKWYVDKIKSDKNHLIVSVIIPNKNAGTIMDMSFEQQNRILLIGCPNKHEKIYNMMDDNHILKIEYIAQGAGVFSDIYCEILEK